MKRRSDKPWDSLHLCGGSGGGGLGAKRAGASGKSIDIKRSACRNYEKLVGEEALCEDILTMKPGDLRDYVGEEAPDVVVCSAPCKGLSRCMGKEKAQTEKYQRLNSIGPYAVDLAITAWPERPPPIILFENVPGMRTKENRPYLERVVAMLQANGYSVDERVHDCGEIGGLAQRRLRVLLAARHMEQVPNFIRLPPTKRVRGIGEVLGQLPVPLPGSTAGGPMHRLPRLSAMNWVRLALIRAGKDWRDLPPGVRLRERVARQNGGFGVNDWEEPAHTVLAEGTVRNTWASVADPRVGCKRRDGGHGVKGWDEPSACVIANPIIDNWPLTVADPRLNCEPRNGAYGVVDWNDPSHTVLGHHAHDNAAGSVADPRLVHAPRPGAYGVVGWAEPSHVVRSNMTIRQAPAAVADPRVPDFEIEGPPFDINSRKPCHMVIESADGTWHRPMTTLELAALQSYPVYDEPTGEWLVLDGENHDEWREAIGDSIPPDSAEAIIRECIATLAMARDGFQLVGDGGIWVGEREMRAC
jgi:site-specific DNA-cytosine methylase